MLTSYLWGWLADRYGSKPVALCGLALTLLLPVAWLLMPRHQRTSLLVALGIAVGAGMANLAWTTGTNRLLYVNLVPSEKRTAYMTLYYACVGVLSGCGQLLAGWLLAHLQHWQGRWWLLPVDAYLPLFAAGVVLPLGALFCFRAVHTADTVSPSAFVRLFLRGNAFQALEGLLGLHLAKDEATAVVMTQRLGQADSPLAVAELIAALADPRFWVRFEAVIAIAHMQPDPQLRTALVEVLNSGDPVLSVVAAWALGRMGDPDAVAPLRDSLAAPNRLVQGYSARALGRLQDRTAVPALLARLRAEPDPPLQVAYAAALGQLRAQEALPALLALLRQREEEPARLEIALAVARILGCEVQFLQLCRPANQDAATALAQLLLTIKKKVTVWPLATPELLSALDACAETVSREQLAEGVALLCGLLDHLPQAHLPPHYATLLQACRDGLGHYGPARLEYVVLSLHLLNHDWPATH